jgi:thiamine biosynthesis lipoprotein
MLRVEQTMGMPIEIDVRDPHINLSAVDDVFDWFRWVDSTFSTHRADSEISRINSGRLARAEANQDVQRVLDRCEELREETGGYFDIRTNSLPLALETKEGTVTREGVDPSGLVKGWSVERGAQILDAVGARNYCINAGGDVRVRGGALPDAVWRIGIQHPYVPDKVAGVVAVSDLAVATSGTYARGEHIVDPRTGKRPEGVLSASVVGPDLATADAYATAIFAMGQSGPEWMTRLFGYEAMIVLADDTVLTTRWWPSA